MEQKASESLTAKFIKSMLGAEHVDVELTDEDFNQIEQHALDVLAPYYTGRRYVQATGPVINLSEHNPKAIVNILETNNKLLISAEDYAFGGQNIILYTSNFKDRYMSYTAYKMLYDQFKSLRGSDWKYIEPNLYIDGYHDDVVIEMLVRPQVFSDIETTSMYYPWVKQYCLALAKEIVGRKRSKFTVNGSPYTLDGAELISEAQQEQRDLESKLIGHIDLY